MRKLFEIGDRYAAQSGWEDFALVKLCLCAMGVLIGLCVKPRHKKAAALSAMPVFAVTYVFLMKKLFLVAAEVLQEKK